MPGVLGADRVLTSDLSLHPSGSYVARDDRSDFHLGADTNPHDERARELPGDTVRIAVVGNFSGAARASDAPRVWPVDLDNFDDVIAAAHPRVRLVLDRDLPPVDATFASLDDFHPDRLAQRLPLFASLRALRDAPPPAAPSPNVERVSADALTVAEAPSGSFLDMIIDADPATPIDVVRRAAPKDDLSEFVSRTVKRHAPADRPAQNAELAAKVDALIGSTMRVVLHHPDFQALESLWRSVAFLLRRLDTDGRLRLFLIDAPADGIDAAVQATGNRGWSLVIVDHLFGAAEVDRLATLAATAARAGTAVIAGGASDLLGVPALPGRDDVDDWSSDMPGGWDQLRDSAAAAHVAVAMPRVLLRLPYGKGGEECETFRFQEVDPGIGRHDAFLWGNGAFAVAAIALATVADGGEPATHGTLDGLPLHITADDDGLPVSLPCAEVVLGQREMSELLDRGLTPIASMRDGDMVRASRIQAVARPARSLAIRA